MSKIVEAINSMIEHEYLIEDVAVIDHIYFFKYRSYIWSICERTTGYGSDGYDLIYYPGYTKVSDVLDQGQVNWMNEEKYVKYSNEYIKTREATESFNELFQIVKEKLHDVANVLDDIIGKR